MERAIPALKSLPNVSLDSSMVMDESVLRMIFDNIDSSRLVYATDFPVAAMAGRRVRVMDHWVDLVSSSAPASGYRVLAPEIPAVPMALETAFAVLSAGRAAGLPEGSVRSIFFENGMALLKGVRGGSALQRIEAGWVPGRVE